MGHSEILDERETAIKVENITKKFKVYYDKPHSLKERALSLKRNKYEERDVLRGISFEVKKGEAIGLVGHNGCGKSTTLKMLTRIMYPDTGKIEIKGRVSSLLELGAGFHPDMSGRENIYINASIFGLTKKEIDRRLDDIIEFSELEEYIDNPVRTYSSGMYMRLAFSVAINVNAEVLLIDEILGVGDVNFQAKCFNKLMEIKKTGTTIVIVSHAMSQIEMICDRSIWIHDGLVRMEGDAKEVGDEYLSYMEKLRKDSVENEPVQKNEEKVYGEEEDATVEVEEIAEKERIGSGEARFKVVKNCNTEGDEQYILKMQKSKSAGSTYMTTELNETPTLYVKVYYRGTEDFSEKRTSMHKAESVEDGHYRVQMELKNENCTKVIRIDPVEGQPCIIDNFIVNVEGEKIENSLIDNGAKGVPILLNSNDPQIICNIEGVSAGVIEVKFDFYLRGEKYFEKLHEIIDKMSNM